MAELEDEETEMSAEYEPPTCMSGEKMSLYPLATGVIGYAIQTGNRIYIPVIEAVKEGSGQVGKFLDSLSPRCCIPNVVSGRLREMLERRGWQMEVEHDPEYGPVDIWKRP